MRLRRRQPADVRNIGVVLDAQRSVPREVVEITNEFGAIWEHAPGVDAETVESRRRTTTARRRAVVTVVDEVDQRVPVVTQVELDVRLASVALVDADQLIMTRIDGEETTCQQQVQ